MQKNGIFCHPRACAFSHQFEEGSDLQNSELAETVCLFGRFIGRQF